MAAAAGGDFLDLLVFSQIVLLFTVSFFQFQVIASANTGVSGLNAPDKTPMTEMPPTFLFGVWVAEHFLLRCLYFGIGVLS